MIFLRHHVKCRRYIQAFILHNFFSCASNQNPPGLTIEKVISSGICNFHLIQGTNRRLKMRFVFCVFPRRYVKCCRYIQHFILHNIFICASNQTPLGMTIEKVISSGICNFCLIPAKNRRLKMRFVFCDFSEARCQLSQVHLIFILHNIFISSSNQNPPGLTIERVISS